MKKLLEGIAEFHQKVRPSYRERFARLALGQSPDCLFVACSDSRVVPNLFASTEPGDLFVVRNVGNVIPPAGAGGAAGASEGAAVDFALVVLGVRDVVVCGHSECGAMKAICAGDRPGAPVDLARWLEVARPALSRPAPGPAFAAGLPPHDRLSQLNVLQQLDNLATRPEVARRVADGSLGLHAWWFDLAEAEVHVFDPEERRFRPLVGQGPACPPTV